MSARILIADEAATGRVQWQVRLNAAHYQVSVIDALDQAADYAQRERPDVLVLCNTDMDRLIATCLTIKAVPALADAPILLIGPGATPQARLAALAAGADELMSTPIDDAVCLARIRALLRVSDARAELERRRSTAEEFGFCEAATPFERPGRIALVARSRTRAMDWRDALVGKTRDRIEVLGENAALATAENVTAADVYVIDIGADRPDEGFRLLADLRARAETRRASVLAVVQSGDADAAVRALDLGASDLLPDDFEPRELALRVKAQIRRKQEADMLTLAVEDGMRLAATDSLTGLYNRRYAMTHAKRILTQAAAEGRPVALMIGDLDHFKRVNDTLGHAAGDTVLMEVANRLRANLRSPDVLARIGGEEFLIVMSETDIERAAAIAERTCELLATTPIVLEGGTKSISVTMSIGVAATDPDDLLGGGLEALLDKADRALYAAKSAGRNQITVAAAA
ncbi:MAG: diguanylate cyclase [Pseudomonadota bacterium]